MHCIFLGYSVTQGVSGLHKRRRGKSPKHQTGETLNVSFIIYFVLKEKNQKFLPQTRPNSSKTQKRKQNVTVIRMSGTANEAAVLSSCSVSHFFSCAAHSVYTHSQVEEWERRDCCTMMQPLSNRHMAKLETIAISLCIQCHDNF